MTGPVDGEFQDTELAKAQRKSQRQRDAIRALETALRRAHSRLAKKTEDLKALEAVVIGCNPDVLEAWRAMRGIPTSLSRDRMELDSRRKVAR